ncbi:MAG TPA: thiamine pyrophosphate-dependent dehydrogenase E1 component subunit alpha [Candidatus Binatia bacterium]|nr:thiamine pyrophosphate-dependent dehydrogenase E1 component subunit alpha [Candidatus Binatia bacterium]
MDLPRGRLLDAYRTMRTIRSFEQTLNELSLAGRVPGFLHLYAGEEAVAAGVSAHLGDPDWVASTHRGHGHAIAKGVELGPMMAEIFGRRTGVCKGKGGSMHIADTERGMLGANGIVGGGVPLAIGAALSAKVLGTGGVAVSFCGDGATNEGAFHESCNLAAILKLPVVFVVENNGYGEATPVEYHVAVEDLAVRAQAYGMPGVVADGMDFFDVFTKAGDAIARARRGDGPTLLECKTYRYFGHYVGDPLTYRTKEETEKVRTARDPLDRFAARVTGEKRVTGDDLARVDDEVAAAIAAAVRFAEASPPPEPADLLTDVYVRYAEPR